MADLLKMDPARIARLRDPARREQIDPATILDHIQPQSDGPVVDVGAGVGFVSLPFARLLTDRDVIACDIQAGMVELLQQDADAAGLETLKPLLMPGPATLPLADDSASMLVMLQVHHELDEPVSLLKECRRVLASGAPIVIIDWTHEVRPGMPSGGRRVPAADIRQHLADAGFHAIQDHPVYPIHSMTSATA